MPALQNSLRETGFIDDSGPLWANLDPAKVRARLGDDFELVPEKT